MVRPANQLQLSEAEMKEEHTRVLTANDPNGESTAMPRAMFKTKLRLYYVYVIVPYKTTPSR